MIDGKGRYIDGDADKSAGDRISRERLRLIGCYVSFSCATLLVTRYAVHRTCRIGLSTTARSRASAGHTYSSSREMLCKQNVVATLAS